MEDIAEEKQRGGYDQEPTMPLPASIEDRTAHRVNIGKVFRRCFTALCLALLLWNVSYRILARSIAEHQRHMHHHHPIPHPGKKHHRPDLTLDREKLYL